MDARTYPEFSTNYPLLLTTLMKRPVNIYPNEIGVVYRNQATAEYQRFTWLEWYKRTCRLANGLKRLGVEPGKPGIPGDRIATMALNTHRHLEIYYGAPGIGATDAGVVGAQVHDDVRCVPTLTSPGLDPPSRGGAVGGGTGLVPHPGPEADGPPPERM